MYILGNIDGDLCAKFSLKKKKQKQKSLKLLSLFNVLIFIYLLNSFTNACISIRRALFYSRNH